MNARHTIRRPREIGGARRTRFALRAPVALAAALVISFAASSATPATPQQTGAATQEVAANLATGRVVFCVAKDAILVASVEGGGETGSRPPVIVPLSGVRLAVILGAVEWNQPDSGKTLRLDAELPVVVANSIRRPSDAGPVSPETPTEIESIGVGVLEVVRRLTDRLHHKLDLAPDEPLIEILLADYVENYGAEIWRLQYRVRQDNLGNDFWNTRLLRPAYYQIYPPEKGQRRTLAEVRYPSDKLSQPTLLSLLDQGDEQMARIGQASPELTQAVALLVQGASDKADATPVANFLRAALPVQAGGQARLALAKLDAGRGFQWLLAPQDAAPPPAQTGSQGPAAPSLRRYNPSQQR